MAGTRMAVYTAAPAPSKPPIGPRTSQALIGSHPPSGQRGGPFVVSGAGQDVVQVERVLALEHLRSEQPPARLAPKVALVRLRKRRRGDQPSEAAGARH